MQLTVANSNSRRPPVSGRRGFTLIEIIVVVVLLGIVAGLVVPRITTNDRRLAEAKVKEVASMLSIVAQRNAMASEHLALSYSRTTGSLEFQVMRTKGDETRWEKPRWASDPLVPSVKLEKIVLTDAIFDGGRGDSRAWRMSLAPFQPRPNIELVFKTEPGIRPEGTWRIELLPYATNAALIEGSSALPGESLRSIDLDAQGLGESTW